MTRKIKPAGTAFEFAYAARQYLELRDLVNAQTKPKNALSSNLKDYIRKYGVEDEQGNMELQFPDTVVIDGASYTGLQLRKKAVPVYDEDKAMELVEEKGVLDRIPSETIVTYDWEDGLHVLNALKVITDEELDGVMDEEVEWSLQVVK